jgi:hypothetical protein
VLPHDAFNVNADLAQHFRASRLDNLSAAQNTLTPALSRSDSALGMAAPGRSRSRCVIDRDLGAGAQFRPLGAIV